MNFGAVYCPMNKNNAWGDRANIQYSIPNKPECLLLSTSQEYIDRVTVAGGTVEATQCLDDNLYKYGFPFNPND